MTALGDWLVSLCQLCRGCEAAANSSCKARVAACPSGALQSCVTGAKLCPAPSFRTLPVVCACDRGVPVDYRAAYENFVSAADGATDGYALYNLGFMYLKGWYVARDPHQALQYFKRALERGVGAAANAIGVLAAHGEGMPADMYAAARWFEKGANMSDPDSIYNLGTLYLHGECSRRAAAASASCAV